jgi:hypothetical protein
MRIRHFKGRRGPDRAEEDPTGLSQAVRDFNSHGGPARIFYNRGMGTFWARCYEEGADRWWPSGLSDSPDVAELYRKTTEGGDDRVDAQELRMMEDELQPYSVW